MHDVPSQLQGMGVEVADGLTKSAEAGDTEVLNKFTLLPKLFSGRQINIEFEMGDVRTAYWEDSATLDLEIGATVACTVSLARSGQTFAVYGEREMAFAMLSVPKGSVVTARVSTAFGTRTHVEWCDDGPVPTINAETGLVIKEILSTDPPTKP
jgi:hypothetical protein